MVKDDNCWPCLLQSARELAKLKRMSSLLDPRQEDYLPACINSGTRLLSTDMALPRFAEPNISSLRIERANEDRALLHCFPPCFQNLLPAAAPYCRGNGYVFSDGLCGTAVPNALPVSSQRKLFIFDQCGTQTRLLHSSICPPITNQNTATREVSCHYGLHKDEQPAELDQTNQIKSILHDESADNYECGDESEMREDTDEINALLYSDDDYSEDDEDDVRSTGHSPMVNIGSYAKQQPFEEFREEVSSFEFPNKRHIFLNMGSYDKHGQGEGITEEVSGYNGPNKRQKLLDTATSVKLDGSHNLDSCAESSHAMSKAGGDEICFISIDKQARKETIRGTLKILESIVPGTKGKDPLVVLDDAISYLKCLKLKATTLGVDSLIK